VNMDCTERESARKSKLIFDDLSNRVPSAREARTDQSDLAPPPGVRQGSSRPGLHVRE